MLKTQSLKFLDVNKGQTLFIFICFIEGQFNYISKYDMYFKLILRKQKYIENSISF